MSLGQSIPILNNILHITYIHNTGVGFGLLKGLPWIPILVSIIVIGGIIYYSRKLNNKDSVQQYLLAFILGGTIGNLIDRVAFGFVIDFLDFRIWPIFNFADMFLSIGVIGLIIVLWKK
jgi:signal peptidase II